MLPLSSLTQRITPAGTAAFIEASERVRLQGGDVISLAAAEPFTAISPEVNRAAIDMIEREATRFSGISGTQALKAALQDKFLQGNGLHYDNAQILVANGSKPLMAAALFALLEPGDEVVLPAPYYNAHHELVILAGGRPVSVPTYAKDRFIVQPDALAAAIGPRTRAVFFSNPNNPAGSIYTAEDWLQLAPILQQHPQLALLIDEIFENWAFGERVKASAPAVLPALQERTALINGFSKGFSMNGWRLGFAAGPSQLIQAMEDIQTHLSGQPSPIVQAGAVAALRHHGQPSTQELSAARQLRDEATTLLNRIAGLHCHVPDATFLLFPDCSAALGQRSASGRVLHTDTDYALALLAETGVAVVPGSDFGTAGHFRMSCAKGRDTVLEAIGRIAQFHQGLHAV